MRTILARAFERRAAILALGVALWAVGVGGRAFGDDEFPPSIFWSGPDPSPREPWYVSTDAILLQRLYSDTEPISTLGGSPTGAVALSHQSLDDPMQAGFQMLVGHTFDDSPYQAEVSYFWLNPLDVTSQATDPVNGSLTSPFTGFGTNFNAAVDNNSLVSIHEISRLEGGEVNLKTQLQLPPGDPTIVLMFGVRHLALRENFDYASVPTGNPNPVSVTAHTNNNIWGPQIGGLVDYGRQCVWLRFEGKAAFCNDEADRALNANIGGVDTAHPRATSSGTTTIADIRATILWHPTAALTARIGYQAMWVDQVALASRNFSADVGSLTNAAASIPVDQGGHLVYHGPFAGLQVSW